jgi:hypothetical protein
MLKARIFMEFLAWVGCTILHYDNAARVVSIPGS